MIGGSLVITKMIEVVRMEGTEFSKVDFVYAQETNYNEPTYIHL